MPPRIHPNILPEFVIEGTTFIIDIRLEEFREKDAPWNRISFDNLFEIEEPTDEHTYTLVYNTETKSYPEPEELEELGRLDKAGVTLPRFIKLVKIPSLMNLDPDGMERLFKS